MKPVLTKRDFVRRYALGEFGNASPTWNDLEDVDLGWLRTEGQLFHIRNRVAGGPTYYDIPGDELADRWFNLIDSGVAASSLYISAMAPTSKTLIQGEVQQSVNHLDLFYTTVALPMRDALRKSSEQVDGIMAVCLLSSHLCPNSMRWLNYLIDAYPEHVIEFSTYSTEWGTIPGFNTVFWEVRKY